MIHGAAGAVGSLAVQLAKSKGVRVVGTGRAKVESLVRDLGADDFVDVEQDGWEDGVEQVDVVFDTIGGDVLARSSGVVKSGGALISVASPPPEDRDDIRTVFFVRDPSGIAARRDRPSRRRRHGAAPGRCRLSLAAHAKRSRRSRAEASPAASCSSREGYVGVPATKTVLSAGRPIDSPSVRNTESPRRHVPSPPSVTISS